MVTKLPKVDVVTIGVGWSAGIIAAELTKQGKKVVGLERGIEKQKIIIWPMMNLDMRVRHEMMQDLFKRNDYFP